MSCAFQYTHLHSLDPDLASRSALSQERETASVTSQVSYGPAIHQALIEIRSRPLPRELTSPYIGTVKEVREKVRLEDEKRRERLDARVLAPLLLPLDEYEAWGYVSSVPSDVKGDSEPTALGQSRICGRCNTSFIVSASVSYLDLDRSTTQRECRYHWGRVAPERVEGRKVWLYSCCKAPRGSEGCEEGLHVFSDDVKGLEVTPEQREEACRVMHQRRAFKTTGEVREGLVDGGRTMDVVAIDCEMISKLSGQSPPIQLTPLPKIRSPGWHLRAFPSSIRRV